MAFACPNRYLGSGEVGIPMTKKHELIRALVIDDSVFSRQTITRMLKKSPLVEVIGVARDGEDALRKTLNLKPDLITLNLEMPRMDGFTFLRIVMPPPRFLHRDSTDSPSGS